MERFLDGLRQQNVRRIAELVMLNAVQALLQLERLVWLLGVLCVLENVRCQLEVVANSLHVKNKEVTNHGFFKWIKLHLHYLPPADYPTD